MDNRPIKKLKGIITNVLQKLYPKRETRLDRPTLHHHSQVRISIETDLETFKRPDDATNFDRLIEVISKNVNMRTPIDIHVILRYLNKTELMDKFKKEGNIVPENSLNNLMYMCAMHLQVLHLSKEEFLFKIDDIGDKFYILLRGTLTVLKPIEKAPIRITMEQYFQHLLVLKSNNEKYLFNKTIKANYDILPFTDIEELSAIELILFKFKFRQNIINKKSIDNVLDFFEQNGRQFEEFGIDKEKVKNLYGKSLSEVDDNWLFYINSLLVITAADKIILEKFRAIELYRELKDVIIFSYNKFMHLHAGQYFGDYALDNSNKKRTATVRCEDDAIIGFVPFHIYEEYVQNEKQKVKLKELTFLNENYFFHPMKPNLFEKKFFQHFAPHEYIRGHTLYKEGCALEQLILIKEGQIELSFNASIIDLDNLLKYLVNKFINHTNNKNASLLNSNDLDKHDLVFLKDLTLDNSLSYLRNKPQKFLNDIKQPRKFHLFILSSKDICGLEEIYLGNMNHICKAVIHSEKAKVYRLDVDKLKTVFEAEKNCFHPFMKLANHKIISLIKRIHHMKQTLTDMFLAESKSSYHIEKEVISNLSTIAKSKKLSVNLNSTRNNLFSPSISQGISRNISIDTSELNSPKKENLKIINQVVSPSQIRKQIENYISNISSSYDKVENESSTAFARGETKLIGTVISSLNKTTKISNETNINIQEQIGLLRQKDEPLYFDNNQINKLKASLKNFRSISKESTEPLILRYTKRKKDSDALFITTNDTNLNKTKEINNNINYADTKVSFVNLLELENLKVKDTEENIENNENSKNYYIHKQWNTERVGQKKRKHLIGKLIKNNNFEETSISNTKPHNDANCLPYVAKYKAMKNEFSKTKQNALNTNDKNNEIGQEMMSCFNFNLNNNREKYTVKSVKGFYEESKQKGYSKYLTPNNSMLKMKSRKNSLDKTPNPGIILSKIDSAMKGYVKI